MKTKGGFNSRLPTTSEENAEGSMHMYHVQLWMYAKKMHYVHQRLKDFQ